VYPIFAGLLCHRILIIDKHVCISYSILSSWIIELGMAVCSERPNGKSFIFSCCTFKYSNFCSEPLFSSLIEDGSCYRVTCFWWLQIIHVILDFWITSMRLSCHGTHRGSRSFPVIHYICTRFYFVNASHNCNPLFL